MMVNAMLVGAISASCLVATLFFLRYWRSTRDRFFLLFAVAFLIEGVNRAASFLLVGANEDAPQYYVVRLVAYGLILWAIVDKNRKR